MLVKSAKELPYLDDLKETFDSFKRYKMKLNLSKYAFGVVLGKFLGFMVSQRGIEVNLDKIQAIMNMKPLKNVKDVQSLNGRVAAFNRFVSKATDRCLPLFRVLRKVFKWTDECQQTFEDLKAYLASTSLLSPSKPRKELYLFLAVSPYTVSSTLIRAERKVHKPVY